MSPRRAFRLPRSRPLLDPATFVRRFERNVGTAYGRLLFSRALEMILHAGGVDDWIRAVQRARDDGAISAGLCRFLIVKFVEMMPSTLMSTDPLLGDMSARIDAIERAHGLSEHEGWYVHEGPPEWQELNRQWEERVDVLSEEIFARNGEHELASLSDEARFLDPLLQAGKREMFPDEDDRLIT